MLRGAALFNGIDSRIEVADHPRLRLGARVFSVAVWIYADAVTGDVVGDIISNFNPEIRRGFSLGVVTNIEMTTTTQSNYRNVHFGIDNWNIDSAWTDCGRPGNAVHIPALATINDHLYAGTFEPEADGTGHLYRYDGKERWIDCGATPDRSNAVGSVTQFNGEIYCCTGRYNPNGSQLGDAQNTRPGGRVYKVDEKSNWMYCGHPGADDAIPEDQPTNGYETGKADDATSLTVYHGDLFATSHHRRGAFRYDGEEGWQNIGPDNRLISFVIHEDRLYTLVNGGPIYRYNGDNDWTYCGTPERATQIYSAVTYAGDLYVGTWPDGALFRYGGGEQWERVGKAGYEQEIMGMVLYNAKVYCGSLPMANAWRLDRDGLTFIANADNTPTAYLRRLWSLAVYRGRLFGGTLPSGHIMSLSAGEMATCDRALAPGWRHIVATRRADVLELHVDGNMVARSRAFQRADYDLTTDSPLSIGYGVGHAFRGAMRDLRIYNTALGEAGARQFAQAK